MPTVVMERLYEQAQTETQIDTTNQSIATCLDINGVTHLQSLVSPDRTRFICLFDAPDAATVRRAIDSAGVTYQKIWTADVFKGA